MERYGEEEQFRRGRTVNIFETENTIIDEASGEILRSEKTTKKRTSEEPDYIKVYYKVMLAANGIDKVPLDFILALSSYIGFANGERVLFFNNKTIRTEIAKKLDIGENMTSKHIKRCVEAGLLFPCKGERGTYEVNPWMIARGKWKSIKELQAGFTFVEGQWVRIVENNKEKDEDDECED